MPIDKDNGSTYLMCPNLYWHRLKALFSSDSINYEEVTSKTAQEVHTTLIEGLGTLNSVPGLTTQEGNTPHVYLLPKDKALETKDRPLVSYFRHPQKKKLNVAGRMLMWLLKQLQLVKASNVQHHQLSILRFLRLQLRAKQRQIKQDEGEKQ